MRVVLNDFYVKWVLDQIKFLLNENEELNLYQMNFLQNDIYNKLILCQNKIYILINFVSNDLYVKLCQMTIMTNKYSCVSN